MRDPNELQVPEECRAFFDSLRRGQDISEPALYPGSLAQSDYSILFTSNARELAANPTMVDFAAPGALYMIRHGVELWLKCILANHDLDRLLRIIVGEELEFDALCEPEVLKKHGIEWERTPNKPTLRTALCVMRNVLVSGMGYPDCRKRRISDRDATQALAYLRRNPATPRERLAAFYVPAIGGHDLMGLWAEAYPYIHDLRSGASRFAVECGGGHPLE